MTQTATILAHLRTAPLDPLEALREYGCLQAREGKGSGMKKLKCSVRDEMFVDPCDALERSVDNISPAFSPAKGIAFWESININTREPHRSYFGIKSKTYPKGMLFNFCPFCGVQIDTPFNKQSSEAAA